MELFSHIFLHIEHMIFWLEIFFAIEIKKCACTRFKKSPTPPNRCPLNM